MLITINKEDLRAKLPDDYLSIIDWLAYNNIIYSKFNVRRVIGYLKYCNYPENVYKVGTGKRTTYFLHKNHKLVGVPNFFGNTECKELDPKVTNSDFTPPEGYFTIKQFCEFKGIDFVLFLGIIATGEFLRYMKRTPDDKFIISKDTNWVRRIFKEKAAEYFKIAHKRHERIHEFMDLAGFVVHHLHNFIPLKVSVQTEHIRFRKIIIESEAFRKNTIRVGTSGYVKKDFLKFLASYEGQHHPSNPILTSDYGDWNTHYQFHLKYGIPPDEAFKMFKEARKYKEIGVVRLGPSILLIHKKFNYSRLYKILRIDTWSYTKAHLIRLRRIKSAEEEWESGKWVDLDDPDVHQTRLNFEIMKKEMKELKAKRKVTEDMVNSYIWRRCNFLETGLLTWPKGAPREYRNL